MARGTIRDVISRIRNQIKSTTQDAFITDRIIYSFVLKHAKWLMKREDGKNKIMQFSSVMQTMDFVELVEVDKVEACCAGVTSNCTIKRTKEKLPVFMQGYYGPLIRAVTSLDNSEIMQPTTPTTYVRFSNGSTFKYNKTKYYWHLNDYLYFPDLEWDAIRVEGIFEDDISAFTCAEDSCITKQDQSFNVPDYLLGELEAQVAKDMVGIYQIPPDTGNDKVSLTR